jgi:hypothetical protein
LGRYVAVVWVAKIPNSSDYEIIGLSFEVKALSVNLTGTYTGTLTETLNGYTGSGDVTMTIIQNGATFSGTWTATGGGSGSGTLSGSIIGNSSFSMNITRTDSCPGNGSGGGSILNSGDTLSGSLSGNICEGAFSLTFTMHR